MVVKCLKGVEANSFNRSSQRRWTLGLSPLYLLLQVVNVECMNRKATYDDLVFIQQLFLACYHGARNVEEMGPSEFLVLLTWLQTLSTETFC